MPNPFTCLGFDVHDAEGVEALAQLTSQSGEAIAAPAGYYLYYKVDANIELWGQVSPTADLLDCVPHYRGEGRISLGVGDLLRRRDQPLDGSVYGWADPKGGRADTGAYPVVIKIPDFEIFRSRVQRGSVITMQVTAFANELESYLDEETFLEAQPERMKLAVEAFVPSGIFSDTGEVDAQPSTQAIFSGHVMRVDVLTNGMTGHEYYHYLVSTYGGVYDVVADPALVQDQPEEGWIVRGSFRLSGRLAS